MGFDRTIKKLCKQVAYGVGIRPVNSAAAFHIKYPSAFCWYADPFVCGDGNREYVFVELMHTYRRYGQIAVAPVSDGKIGKFQIVISEPFHMSFPNVFRWEKRWYMIPETYQSRQVRLYVADVFPYKWHLDRVLLQGVNLVDHALYPAESGMYMVSYDQSDRENSFNRTFYIDMHDQTCEEFFPEGDWCKERPGGTFYQKHGAWRHVIQDCELEYGEYLHVFQVNEFSREKFSEKEISQIHIDDKRLCLNDKRLQYIHTYNCDDKYEVIDVRYDKIYPDKFFFHQWQEILKRIKR